MATPIGTLGTIPTMTIGGRVFTDLTNLITLVAYSTGGGTANATFRKTSGNPGSGYLPSGSNKFHVWAAQCSTNGANSALTLLYADVDVGFNVATAFTNPVYPGGTLLASRIDIIATVTNQAYEMNFVVLNGKYTCGILTANAITNNVRLWGYEEA